MHDDRSVSISGVVTLAAAAALLFAFHTVLWPLALALVLATLIHTLSRRVSKALPRAADWVVFAITATLVGVLVTIGMLVIATGSTRLVSDLPSLYRRIDELVASIRLPGVAPLSLSNLSARINLAPLVATGLAGAQSAVTGLALTFIYLVFMLASRGRIEKRVLTIIASRSSDALMTVLERSIGGVEAYMYIQTITGLMIAIASGAVMLGFGLQDAIFWSLTLLMFSYLPVVGVLVGSIGPTLFALMQFPTLGPATGIFIGIHAAAFVVGNLIMPKMQAESQNIDPTVSLLAIGVWTILWGVPGAFLAIPLTLALVYSLAQYPSLRGVAILMSNDGAPLPPSEGGTAYYRFNDRPPLV
jgi:AI-2 transport protein TqsA